MNQDTINLGGGILVTIIFVFLFSYFWDFILKYFLFLVIVSLLFFINYGIVVLHEDKYKKNFPYKPYKSKKNIGERILIGLLAGLHFLFYIGSYDHKKYNTQVFYPETIECVFGNISQFLIWAAFIFIEINLFESFGYYSLFFMIIPIITNIISIIRNR